MKFFKLTFTFVLVLALIACSGGSGESLQPADTQDNSNAPINTPIAGITGTGIAAGAITSFGSIWVNGVRYDTDTANFEINGEPGTQSDLSVGQFVVIKGSIDQSTSNGTATDVIYNDDVKGPVQSIDVANASLLVLGQTVLVTASTSFDDSIPGTNLGGLSVGDVVEVSGTRTSDRSIAATRIELKPANTEFEVLGVVEQLDATNMTFMINQLVVDYSAAMLDDFPSGSIENGQLVEAKGTQLNGQDHLVATQVELKTSNISGSENDFIELEGFITRFVSVSDFDVAGIPVITSASTVYQGGTEAELGLNTKVEVEGRFNDSGQIVAEEIEIERSKAVRMEATVDEVSAENNQFVVLGITVTVDGQTRVEDKSDADLEPFSLSNLNSGDFVEVRGSEQPPSSGNVLATILEREEPDDETELQGFVTAINDQLITVLGVTIDTSNALFKDENEGVLSRQQFFDRLAINSLIEAEGVEINATTIMAEEVEFEVED